MLLIAILASFCTSASGASSSSNIRPVITQGPLPGLEAMGQAPPDWVWEYMAQAPDFGYMPQEPFAPPGIDPEALHEYAHTVGMQAYKETYQRWCEEGLNRFKKKRARSPSSNKIPQERSDPMRVETHPSMMETPPIGVETPYMSNAQSVLPQSSTPSNVRHPLAEVPPPTMPDRLLCWKPRYDRFSTLDKSIVSPAFESHGNVFKATILPPSKYVKGRGKNSLKSGKGQFRIEVRCEKLADEKNRVNTASFIFLVERLTSNGWEEMNQKPTLQMMDLSNSWLQDLDEIFDLNMEGDKSMGLRISIHQA